MSARQTSHGHDRTCAGAGQGLKVLAVRSKNPRDVFGATRVRELDLLVHAQRAFVHAHKGHFALREALELEDLCAQRTKRIHPQRVQRTVFAARAPHGAIQRRGREVHHCIEQGVHAHIQQCRAAQERHELTTAHTRTQSGAQARGIRSAPRYNVLEQRLIALSQALEQLLVQHLRFHGHGRRARQIGLTGRRIATCTRRACARTHDRQVQQIDDTNDRPAFFVWPRNGQQARLQTFGKASQQARRVSTGAIQLVQKQAAREPRLCGGAPHTFRARLHSSEHIHHHHQRIESQQRPIDLNAKVHVTRRVDEFDARPFPGQRGRGGGDGDATLAFLFHPIEHGRALFDLAHAALNLRIKEQALTQRGLAGIHMRSHSNHALQTRIKRRCLGWTTIQVTPLPVTMAPGAADADSTPESEQQTDSAPAARAQHGL